MEAVIYQISSMIKEQITFWLLFFMCSLRFSGIHGRKADGFCSQGATTWSRMGNHWPYISQSRMGDMSPASFSTMRWRRSWREVGKEAWNFISWSARIRTGRRQDDSGYVM